MEKDLNHREDRAKTAETESAAVRKKNGSRQHAAVRWRRVERRKDVADRQERAERRKDVVVR